MRRVILISVLSLAAAATAVAQKPAAQKQKGGMQKAATGIKLSDVAGTWAVQTMIPPKDSVVNSELVATADGKGWVTKLAGRDPIPTRIVATGGDSIVTEAGPYESILRPGVTVTSLKVTGHYQGDTMTGTMEAHYSTGDVLKGKVKATRKK
jgi:hypothetical protein